MAPAAEAAAPGLSGPAEPGKASVVTIPIASRPTAAPSAPAVHTPVSPGHVALDQLVTARKAVICGNVALNYSKAPIHVVRGSGQFLYDADGEEYLDCVNNVCHVGHCHPEVVQAVCAQVAQLNTNSRYLHSTLLAASKALTATLPAELSVVFWVNSGSEANDLALRLARTHTKKRGVLCVGGAYHGHVTTMIDASPYKFDRTGGTGQRCGRGAIPSNPKTLALTPPQQGLRPHRPHAGRLLRHPPWRPCRRGPGGSLRG